MSRSGPLPTNNCRKFNVGLYPRGWNLKPTSRCDFESVPFAWRCTDWNATDEPADNRIGGVMKQIETTDRAAAAGTGAGVIDLFDFNGSDIAILGQARRCLSDRSEPVGLLRLHLHWSRLDDQIRRSNAPRLAVGERQRCRQI